MWCIVNPVEGIHWGNMTATTMTAAVEKVPEWLDDLFVHKCLQNYYPDNKIMVHSVDAGLATAKGENYASQIYRAVVVYSDKREKEENVRQSGSGVSNCNGK